MALPQTYRPRPRTIIKACAKIRETWDDREYACRAPHLKRVECEIQRVVSVTVEEEEDLTK